MATEYAQETIWFDKWRYDDAERQYYEKQALASTGLGSLANQIAKAREEIQSSLAAGSSLGSTPAAPGSNVNPDIVNRITKLEGENKQLHTTVATLEKTVSELVKRISALECGSRLAVSASAVPQSKPKATPEPPKANDTADDDDDDDVDLFGSDDDEEEDEAAAKVREDRLKAYADKKSKKPGPIAKSSVLLDCKPWDDETDMKVVEDLVRKVQMDGLVWGAAKLVPLAFGIKKLSIVCIVEDDKVSIDDLIELITANEDYVQSVDIAAFNKI